MRAPILLTALLCSILLAPTTGYAVEYDTVALGRIGSFMLILEAIDTNSKTCGIAKPAILQAIEYPIIGKGLTIVPKDNVTLDTSITSIIIMNGSVCVTNYRLEMTVTLPVFFEGQTSLEQVTLWSSGGLISSPISEHAARLNEALSQQGRELVVSWSSAREGRTTMDWYRR